MKLVSSFLAKKDSLGADAWGSTDKNIKDIITPVEDLFYKEFKDYKPFPSGQRSQINLMIRHILIAEALLPEYCNLFKNLSDKELVAVAESFRFENYVKRSRLEDILTGKEK
jgi:endoglucanase